LESAKIEDVVIGAVIGAGNFGKVYKGVWQETTTVALKELVSDRVNDFLAEANILLNVKHPRCLRCYGIFQQENKLYMVTEFAAKGSLLGLLRNQPGSYSKEKLYQMASDTASGMHYLESMKIVHRDLSARNLLVDENGRVKVSDFGLSRSTADNMYKSNDKSTVPVRWTSPEAVHFGQYSSKSDVWSFGVVMYEIITEGKNPYAAMSNEEVMQKIQTGYRMPCPIECDSPAYYALMLKCWSEKPEGRPSFLDVKREIDTLFEAPTYDAPYVSVNIAANKGQKLDYMLSPRSGTVVDAPSATAPSATAPRAIDQYDRLSDVNNQ